MNIMEANLLRDKVKLGMECHKILDMESCERCPYSNTNDCGWTIMNDALMLADYWKDKYKSAPLMDQKPMILNVNQEPSLVKVDSSDIRKTLKYSEAVQKLADTGKKASEALREVTEAIKGLKDVFPDEPPEIPEVITAKWKHTCYVKKDWTGECTNCHAIAFKPIGTGIPKVCPKCKAVMTGVE